MSSTDQQFLLATLIISTYGSGLMFIIGTIGNTLNVLAFSCLKVYRPLPTSVFLATASFSAQLYITFSLFLTSLSSILRYDPSSRILALCRATLFIPRVTTEITLTCLCFSAIDRYLMTSHSARQRAWITLFRARLAICLSIVIWLCYGMPSILYSINYSFFNICIPNQNFATAVSYLNFVFAVLIPISILSLFGLLTWKNIGRIRLSSLNVQVTKMILLDVFVVTVSNLPFACFLIYGVINSSNRLFTPSEIFVVYSVQLLTAIQSCGSFYFYLIISPVFRTNIKGMLSKIFWWRKPTVRNGVAPVTATKPVAINTVPKVAV